MLYERIYQLGARATVDLCAAVLLTLDREHNPEVPFRPLRYLQEETGVGRELILAALRTLRAAGLAEYARGLWSENGEPRGAGYAITPAGRRVVRNLEKRQPAHMPIDLLSDPALRT